MNWKYWLRTMCPKDWSNKEVLEFIHTSKFCKDVTLQDVLEERPIVGFFQDWQNGTSALYLTSVDGQDSVDYRIESHYESGTFANAHVFYSEEVAWEVYSEYN